MLILTLITTDRYSDQADFSIIHSLNLFYSSHATYGSKPTTKFENIVQAAGLEHIT